MDTQDARPAIPAGENATCDVAIAGCGVAGLYAALSLPATCQVSLFSKGAVEECDSMLAQGGICVLPEAEDYDSFFEDTMRAGHGANRRESVDIMIRSSRAIVNDLLALGVEFAREGDGSLAFTREGAHARPRIAFKADITGRAITSKLLDAVRALPNVRIYEHVAAVDLIVDCEDGRRRCSGLLCRSVPEELSTCTAEELRSDAPGLGPVFEVRADRTLLATGGIGGVYEHSTNYPQLTGDACLFAAEHGVEMEDLDCVQIHPTGLYSDAPGRTFLISESCRGEGAILLDAAGERFCDELQPRDVVAAAIREQMRRDGTEHAWLSFEPVDRDVVCGHFANIREHCLSEGRDILEEPIPVVPTQHYFMGGVRVDRDSATALEGLYVAGEAACNGVHGKNRLASNSLLESLVFARRAAYSMATGESLGVEPAGEPALDGVHRPVPGPRTALDALIEARSIERKSE